MQEAAQQFRHPHSELVDALGGATKISNDLKSRQNPIDITPQAVSMWRRRGVSIYVRNVIAEMLIQAGVPVPKGFTASRHRGWRTR